MYLLHDLHMECYHDNSIHQLISCTQQESLIIAVIVIVANKQHKNTVWNFATGLAVYTN